MAEENGNVYQFKITLKGTNPSIWRRIQVPGNYNFDELHMAIQFSMGWKTHHLHHFRIDRHFGKRRSCRAYMGQFDEKLLEEKRMKITEYFSSLKTKALYTYDLGDNWEHEVVLENILPAASGASYPWCVAGKMKCPPENCGGTEGYKNLLYIQSNPQHAEYVEQRKWLGGHFDPNAFDPKTVLFRPQSHNMIEKDRSVYQFKVTLKGIKPSIWRRIQVPEYYDFNQLHMAIQFAMGWKYYHLHDFRIKENFRKVRRHLCRAFMYQFDEELVNERGVKITEYFIAPKTKALYTYDFGDNWEHEILFEKTVPAVSGASYPWCMAGKMNCPPEDCGGTVGYKNVLHIQSNPRHAEYEEITEWLGGHFDPNAFDPKTVSFRPKFYNVAEKNGNVYQFKVIIKGTKPPIWRRIQVPENYDFSDLHMAIQFAMGWKNCHLHEFKIKENFETGIRGKQRLTRTYIDQFDELNDEKGMKITEYFTPLKTKALYIYDFGDNWEHEVMLENILPAASGASYPWCVAGKMKCPPEDCGGTVGYKELLNIQSNPQHAEYAEQRKWLGGHFDPYAFHPQTVLFRPPSLNMAEKNGNVYQFKVTLMGTNPSIWRRMQIPENYDFNELHVAIQCAMGWENYHMHDFEIRENFGNGITVTQHLGKEEVDQFDDDLIDEKKKKIAEYFTAPKIKAFYTYDFGDNWEHEILLENTLPAVSGASYPWCVAGEMKCPPEDCGGTEGYRNLLYIQSNPRHAEYKEMRRWLRGYFDPNAFDPETVSFCPPSHFLHELAYDASARFQCGNKRCVRNGRF